MARLIKRIDRLEQPPTAEVSGRAMEFLSDKELELIIGYGRRAVAAAEAGRSGRTRPTPEEEQALARYEGLVADIREGWLW